MQIDRVLKSEIVPGVKLEQFQDKIVVSDDLLGLRIDLASYLADKSKIAIVGSSHTALTLVRALRAAKPDLDIVLLHRSPIKLYYPSEELARKANYSDYSAKDICSVTGRVHRYGGVRLDAFEEGEACLRGDPGAARSVRTQEVEQTLQELRSADGIVSAMGYQARLPEITDASGAPVRLDVDTRTGACIVNSLGHLQAGGRSIPQLISWGLGSGLRPDEAAGGELSFSGRADGVWLYQNDIGLQLLRNFLTIDVLVKQHRCKFDRLQFKESDATNGETGSRGHSWHTIYERKGREALEKESSAGEKVPMHVLGGYDMFSAEKWDQQVASLVSRLVVRSTLSNDVASVCEIGCGAGAFLSSFAKVHPKIRMTGIDYSSALVKVAQERLEGEFYVGNACNLINIANRTFDCTVSFGVVPYLNSLGDVRGKFQEMIRVTRPGGTIYIGEVSDLARKEYALALRAKSHAHVKKSAAAKKKSTLDTSHLYTPKQLWHDTAARLTNSKAKVEIIDHTDLGLTYPTASYRYSVYVTLPEDMPVVAGATVGVGAGADPEHIAQTLSGA